MTCFENGTKINFTTGSNPNELKKPEWFKTKFVQNKFTQHISSLMGNYNLHSVCESAHCPNIHECWSTGTATFMVMGEFCTRGCRFCAIKTMAKPPPLDPNEPENLATAVASLNLKYIVITSVARDDLEDEGSGHFAECIVALKKRMPNLIVEVLVPDFKAKRFALQKIIDAKPDVVSHNVETTERLTRNIRDIRAKYRQSLEALSFYREMSDGKIITKSGMMVGLGESEDEVRQTMKDLRDIGVELFTVGQYLRPTQEIRYVPVKEYVHPDVFKKYEQIGYELGFKYVASGPFVRSSYKAAEPFVAKLIESRVNTS